MSEQELDIDLEAAATAEPEAKAPEKQEPAKPEAPSVDEIKGREKQRALRNGWQDYDDWVAAGNPPDEWKDFSVYNIIGEFTAKLRKRDRDYESQLAGVNKIVQAQRTLLEQRRDEAIDAGDKTLVHKLEGQINDLQRTPVAKSDPLIEDWEQRNPWVLEPGTPKTIFAQSQFAAALASRMTTAQAIKHVESEVAKHFPATKHQGRVPESEKGGGSKGFHKGRAVSVSMSDLTREEQQIWELTGPSWKSQAEFLQSVAESRKGA